MIENHFQPCITEPTRIVEGNIPSLVDNIFTKNINEPICGNILEKTFQALQSSNQIDQQTPIDLPRLGI